MSTRNELNTLEASGLVKVATLEPELEYLFRHALVQDAAYSSLLKQDRRILHRLAADTLLTLYPDRSRELAADIARHFEQAGDPAAAAEHFVVAGEHALERFANREALAFFDQAEARLAPDDARIDLRLRAALGGARAGMTSVPPGENIARLERAAALGDAHGDPMVLGDIYFWIAFLRRLRAENTSTSPELQHAVDRAAELGASRGDALSQAIPNAFLAVGMIFGGGLREGTRLLEESLPVIAEQADPASAAILNGLLTVGYARLGEFAAAERSSARARRIASSGDPIAALDAEITASSLLLERGEFDGGEALATTCAARSEELGAVACAVTASVMSGAAHVLRDDLLGARAPLERGEELSRVSNMPAFQTLAEGLLGAVRTRLGDIPAGNAGWDLALEHAALTHDTYGEAITRWQRARTRARATPPDFVTSLEDIDAALRLFEDMEARPTVARVLRDRAQLLRAAGRAAEAADDDARSQAIATELELKDFP